MLAHMLPDARPRHRPAIDPTAARACAATIERRISEVLRSAPEVARLAAALGAGPDDVVAALRDEVDAIVLAEDAFDLLDGPTIVQLRRRAELRLSVAVREALPAVLARAV